MTAVDVDPWAKRPGETSRAYDAFRHFRDAGPARAVSAVAVEVGVNERTARKWAHAWEWRARADAWDAEVHRIDDARRLDQIRTMDDTHQRAARVLIQTGLRALADVGQLTPHQAARFLDLGTRLERATLLGEHLPQPAVTVEDDDELTPLERIARELAGTA